MSGRGVWALGGGGWGSRRRSARGADVLALLTIVLLLLPAACERTVTTQVVPVARPLPEREQAVYRVLDSGGVQIGRATLTIAAEGATVRLAQDYDFGGGQTDRSTVTVDRDSMRPRASERTVEDGGHRYSTRTSYTPDTVSVEFRDEQGERTRRAAIGESAYDNLESLFLWRTLAMGAGERVSYVNVVVDPKRGTISRALATVLVSGREEVRLAGMVVEAWRVDFTSAGITNHAWYAVTPDRRLVKYAIARGPTLLLESATP
jgi:hypothetical protein